MTDITGLEIVEPKDTTSDKIGNARKAIAAGVAAAFAAGIPIFGRSILDGVITGDEAGLIASAFFGALASVGYVTWQTVNRIKPTDIPKMEAIVGGVPQVVLRAADPATVQYVGLPDVPTDPADLDKAEDEVDETPAPEGYTPKHTA